MEDQSILSIFNEIGPIGTTFVVLVHLFLQYKKDKNTIKKEKLVIKKEEINKLDEINFKNEVRSHFVDDENIHTEITNYLKISNAKYIEEVNDVQVQIIAGAIISCSKHAISDYALRIIEENHISGNEREIKAKIKNFIINRFHKDVLSLKEFSYKEKPISEGMNADWKKHVISTLIEMIINQKEHKAIKSALENIFESFRYEILDNIL